VSGRAPFRRPVPRVSGALRAALAVLSAFAVLTICAACSSAGELDRTTVTMGGASLDVWVADTRAARDEGLQQVPRLEHGEGMLFVWDEAGIRSFAIKGVDYAVDLVFVSADGRVSEIVQLKQGGAESATSTRPARWAVETSAGWARYAGVEVGDEFAIE